MDMELRATKSVCVEWVCNVGSLKLYSIQNGSLTGMQYGYGTSGIIVHPFAGALGPEFILMVDNDQFRRVEWLDGTLDANTIEHVWDRLQRRIVASNVQCGMRKSLERELVDDRGMIPLPDIRKLNLSFRSHCIEGIQDYTGSM